MIFGLLLFVLIRPAQALTIQDARFGIHPDKTRFVLEMDKVSDFRVFTMESPYRIVIDMPNFEWRAQTLSRYPKAGIEAVRLGQVDRGISRIILESRHPLSIQNAFAIPPQDGQDSRIVIDFAKVDAESFAAMRSRVFGTLTVGETVSDPKPDIQSASAVMNNFEDNSYKKNHEPVQKPLVVLDPGHGGADPGAEGANGVFEKRVVLDLAKELKSQLEASGRYRVMLTRERDVFIKLADRVKFARDHGADLFVSIHADSLDKPHVQGASIYTLSDKASDEQTEKLAARENKSDLIAGIDLSSEDEDVVNILMDLAMRDTMNQSRYFANTLVDHFGDNNMKLLERPHRYAGFAVLKAPDIPSVLVEAGFMSNSAEAAKLSSPEYRQRLARALKSGIDNYFQAVSDNKKS